MFHEFLMCRFLDRCGYMQRQRHAMKVDEYIHCEKSLVWRIHHNKHENNILNVLKLHRLSKTNCSFGRNKEAHGPLPYTKPLSPTFILESSSSWQHPNIFKTQLELMHPHLRCIPHSAKNLFVSPTPLPPYFLQQPLCLLSSIPSPLPLFINMINQSLISRLKKLLAMSGGMMRSHTSLATLQSLMAFLMSSLSLQCLVQRGLDSNLLLHLSSLVKSFPWAMIQRKTRNRSCTPAFQICFQPIQVLSPSSSQASL